MFILIVYQKKLIMIYILIIAWDILRKKNQFRAFELGKFAITTKYTVPELRYDNYFLDFKRKIKKKFDFFKYKKSFLIKKK